MMNVFGELNIATGTVDILQTGPVFFNTSILNMLGGTLTTYNSIWFNAGSTGTMTDGILNIRRDLNNQSAEFVPQGGTVRFYGDVLSQLRGPTVFSTLEIDKDTGVIALSYYPSM
jgi:hypothetical protein